VKKAALLEGKTFSKDEEKALDELLQQAKIKSSLWINKKSGILNQFQADVQFTASEKMPGFAIGVRVSFWDFNKPMQLMPKTIFL
jgi:hypothetical protein